jgi:hypothetical protein
MQHIMRPFYRKLVLPVFYVGLPHQQLHQLRPKSLRESCLEILSTISLNALHEKVEQSKESSTMIK